MAFITLQFRRDTAANWTSANPILASGEMGIETDTSQFKIGDGVTVWSALAYGGIQGPAGPSGSAGGSDTQVQFNDGGAFGGDNAFAWNKTTNTMTLSGQATIPLQTLTDAANIDWNCVNGAKAKVTLGGNRTVNAVTNAVEGTSYTLWVIQDGTGNRTLTWETSGAGSFDFGTDGAPTLTTTASKADVLGFEAISIGGTLKLRFVGIKKVSADVF